jgi:hypothetical protein
MADNDRNGSSRNRAEAERYRVAAEEALAQLDWCVSYLHSIRKRRIAAALARNRSEILRRLR